MPLRPRYQPTSFDLRKIERGEAYRASGGVTCPDCGKLYYDHPHLEEPHGFLTRICNGDLVKL